MTTIVSMPEGTPIYRESDELGGPTASDQQGDQTDGLGAL